MASIPRRIRLHSCRNLSRISAQHLAPRCTPQWQRSLCTTPVLRAKPNKEGSATAAAAAAEAPSKVLDEVAKSPSPESETATELRKLVEDLKGLDPEVIHDAVRKGKHGIPFANDFELEEDEDFEIPEDRGRPGFWSEGEDEMGPDEDYYGDDLTSLGHGELEQHRELREYARLIAWELPLLNRMRSPDPAFGLQLID